jgi:NADPH2:quinone reductase
MKAFVCNEFGPIDIHKVEEVAEPELLDGQVLIDVKAAGVSFPEVLIVQGLYQFKPPFPFIPGGEVAGEISKIGNGVEDFKEGDRVIAMTGNGGMAEKVAVFASTLFKLPDSMSFAEGAAFPLNYGTTIHGLKQRAKLQAGETLMVSGAAGGLGITAIHLGKAMGAKVIATASSEDKLEICKKEGADEVVLYPRDMDKDKQKELSNNLKAVAPNGIDVIYDIVGGDYAEPSLRAIARNGRYLVIGFTAGIPKMPLNLTLLKECQIVGVFWGQFVGLEPEVNKQNFDDCFEMANSGKFKPLVSHTYKIEESVEALKFIQDRKATGKVIVEF